MKKKYVYIYKKRENKNNFNSIINAFIHIKIILKNHEEIDYCTQCILLINGEYITAWNERYLKLNINLPKY